MTVRMTKPFIATSVDLAQNTQSKCTHQHI
jgi:hypothetical protein